MSVELSGGLTSKVCAIVRLNACKKKVTSVQVIFTNAPVIECRDENEKQIG